MNFSLCVSVWEKSSRAQWVISWWQRASTGTSLDPVILFPFQADTHQQRAACPTRDVSHCVWDTRVHTCNLTIIWPYGSTPSVEVRANTFLQGLDVHAHLLGLVEAIGVAVGKVKRSKLLAQCMLRGHDTVQGRVQFGVTWTLQQIIDQNFSQWIVWLAFRCRTWTHTDTLKTHTAKSRACSTSHVDSVDLNLRAAAVIITTVLCLS